MIGRKSGEELSSEMGNSEERNLKNGFANDQFKDHVQMEDQEDDEEENSWNVEARGRTLEPCLRDTYPEFENIIQRGTGRGEGSHTGALVRPGRGRNRSQNQIYNRRAIENLDTTTRNGAGIKTQDVVFYGSFFAKIGDGEHRTDFSKKGGKEGLEFIESLEPEVYIPREVRSGKTHTDERGLVQDYKRTVEGYEVTVTNPRLAGEKNLEIYARAYHKKQMEERPARMDLVTNILLKTPKIAVKTTDGRTVEADLQQKNCLFGRRNAGDKGEETIKDPITGEVIKVVEAEEVKRAAARPVAKAIVKLMEDAQYNTLTERSIASHETMQYQMALLEEKVNLIAAQNDISHRNRPTWKELDTILQSENMSKLNVVLKVNITKYNQLKETTSMEGWRKTVIEWFHNAHTSSVYQALRIEYLRVVGFDRINKPRNEDNISIILTWDTEDRVRTILTEYRCLGEHISRNKIPYPGSDLEVVNQKLGKIFAYKSKREQMKDDEFFETTRDTNNKNAKLLKKLGDRTYEETRKKIMKGEWKDIPSSIYTTKRGTDSNGPTTILQEWKGFKSWRDDGNRDKEWIMMVQQQLKYMDAGLKRGAVVAEDQEMENWLPPQTHNRRRPQDY